MDDDSSLPPQDAAVAKLANSITGDWGQVVAVWEAFRAKHRYSLRHDVEADRDSFLRDALWLALGRGQLRALLERLNERGLLAPGSNVAAATLVGPGFSLQAFVNGQWMPQRAMDAGRRLMEACDHVCRIAVDGDHKGTGVLIRPTIVATAAHVLDDLVDATGRAKPGSLARLAITFFDADEMVSDRGHRPTTTTVAQLNPDWLAYWSPRAAGEGLGSYDIECVDGIKAVDGPWDLALVRLAETPRQGLTGQRLRSGEPPGAAFGVHVLHHPGDPLGAPMGLLWSIGDVKKALGDPPLRWLHDANTDAGSSGAPCFDANWRVVGLHQAGGSAIDTHNQANRAVPIYPWADRVDAVAQSAADSTPYLTEAPGEDGAMRPVLGRLDLQSHIWQAMRNGAPASDRVLVVRGGAGSGRTFTGAILTALAAKAGGRVISLDVRNALADDLASFANRLLGAVEAPDELGASGLTTLSRDLRNEVAPTLARRLVGAPNGSPVWLFLDGLEAVDRFAGSGAEQVVDALIAALPGAPELRLALVGWTGAIPGAWEESLPASGPTPNDIAQYLWRAFAPAGAKILPPVLATFETLAAAELAKAPPGTHLYARALVATRALQDIVRSAVEAQFPPEPGQSG